MNCKLDQEELQAIVASHLKGIYPQVKPEHVSFSLVDGKMIGELDVVLALRGNATYARQADARG